MSTIAAPRFRVLAAPHRPLALARLRLVLRVFAVALAALQAWNGRFLLNPDGVSYLDVADAYLRADWHNAINTYWSPLYSWLLAGALAFHPAASWEFAVVKLVNVAVFLGALAAFERLLRELTLQRPARAARRKSPPPCRAACRCWSATRCSSASSCVLTSVAYVSPDLLVSAFVYLLAAETIRVGRAGTTPARSLIFGLLLGLGCLAKAVLLPVGLIFLAASAFRTGSFRRAAVHVARGRRRPAGRLRRLRRGHVRQGRPRHARRRFPPQLSLDRRWRPRPRLADRRPAPRRLGPPAVAAAVRDPGLRIRRVGRRHVSAVDGPAGLVRRPDVALRRPAAAGRRRGVPAGLLLHLPVAPAAADGRPRPLARRGLARRRGDVPRAG